MELAEGYKTEKLSLISLDGLLDGLLNVILDRFWGRLCVKFNSWFYLRNQQENQKIVMKTTNLMRKLWFRMSKCNRYTTTRLTFLQHFCDTWKWDLSTIWWFWPLQGLGGVFDIELCNFSSNILFLFSFFMKRKYLRKRSAIFFNLNFMNEMSDLLKGWRQVELSTQFEGLKNIFTNFKKNSNLPFCRISWASAFKK